jgi:hypothetical protein
MSSIKTMMLHNKIGKNNIKETRTVGVAAKKAALKILKFTTYMDSWYIKVNSLRKGIFTAQSVAQTVPGFSAMILGSTDCVMVLKKRTLSKPICFSTERVSHMLLRETKASLP